MPLYALSLEEFNKEMLVDGVFERIPLSMKNGLLQFEAYLNTEIREQSNTLAKYLGVKYNKTLICYDETESKIWDKKIIENPELLRYFKTKGVCYYKCDRVDYEKLDGKYNIILIEKTLPPRSNYKFLFKVIYKQTDGKNINTIEDNKPVNMLEDFKCLSEN